MQINPLQAIRKYSAKYAELKNFRGSTPEEVFTHIYRINKWGDTESRSGTGSNLVQTETLRRELPQLLQKLGANSMLDIPCGDFYWMSKVDLPLSKYIGADIVNDLIVRNQKKYANQQREFGKLDLISEKLPLVDVVFCRDCLVHLSYQHIHCAIRNIKLSGSRYLLTTHFPQYRANKDIVTGKHRSLNLMQSPFTWPKPLLSITEYDAGRDGNKCLGLWEINNISASGDSILIKIR